MKSRLVVIALAAALFASVVSPTFAGRAGAAAPSSTVAVSVHTHPAAFDKIRFALHMGLAYGAFHRYVWTRYKAGAFAAGAPGRTSTIIKAAAATLFTVYELKKAYSIAVNSNSKTLQLLVSPLHALMNKGTGLYTLLHSGSYSPNKLVGFSTAADLFRHQAATSGYGFSDRSAPVPGAA